MSDYSNRLIYFVGRPCSFGFEVRVGARGYVLHGGDVEPRRDPQALLGYEAHDRQLLSENSDSPLGVGQAGLLVRHTRTIHRRGPRPPV